MCLVSLKATANFIIKILGTSFNSFLREYSVAVGQELPDAILRSHKLNLFFVFVKGVMTKKKFFL